MGFQLFLLARLQGDRLNPFSSFIGRDTAEFRCLTYNCTTSSPARAPVFFTSTLTVSVPSRLKVGELVFKFEYSNVV